MYTTGQNSLVSQMTISDKHMSGGITKSSPVECNLIHQDSAWVDSQLYSVHAVTGIQELYAKQMHQPLWHFGKLDLTGLDLCAHCLQGQGM